MTLERRQRITLLNYLILFVAQVDHRLRLYCEMFLTSHVDEEFYGLVKAELVTFSGSATGLVVVTSRRLYLLKITADEGDQPENWLAKEASYALTDLCCIMTIIGNQGLVLQLDRKDGNMQLYLILLRDERRTKNALHFLLGELFFSPQLASCRVPMLLINVSVLFDRSCGKVWTVDGDGGSDAKSVDGARRADSRR